MKFLFDLYLNFTELNSIDFLKGILYKYPELLDSFSLRISVIILRSILLDFIKPQLLNISCNAGSNLCDARAKTPIRDNACDELFFGKILLIQ